MPRYFVFCSGRDRDTTSLRRLTAHALVEEIRVRELGESFIFLHGFRHGEMARIMANGLGIPAAEEESRRISPNSLTASPDRHNMQELITELDNAFGCPPADTAIVLASVVHCAALANALQAGTTIRTSFLQVLAGGGAMFLDRNACRFVKLLEV